MSRYRIQYADRAEAARQAMDPGFRRRFEQAMTATLGTDPYGHGSTPIKGDRDYRDVTLADALVVYYVSSDVLVVTAVRIVY